MFAYKDLITLDTSNF